MTRSAECRPVRLDQYANQDPWLIFKTRLVFKARLLFEEIRYVKIIPMHMGQPTEGSTVSSIKCDCCWHLD